MNRGAAMGRTAGVIVVGVLAAACGGGTTKSASLPVVSDSIPTAAASPNTISLAGRVFSPAFLTVARGNTVSWVDIGPEVCPNFVGQQEPCPHNVVSIDNLFNSHPQCTGPGTPCMKLGEPFRFTFSTPGTFVYYCFVHATCSGGTCSGMSGRVVVT